MALKVLVPLIAGKILRELIPGLAEFMSSNKLVFSCVSTFFFVCLPWMQVSESSADLHLLKALDIVFIVLVGVSIHLVYLLFNYGVVVFLLPAADLPVVKAVVIVASEKSVALMLPVVAMLPFRHPGFVAITGVICHLAQSAIDSGLVMVWSDDKGEEEASSDAESNAPAKEGKAAGGREAAETASLVIRADSSSAPPTTLSLWRQ